MPVHTTMVDIGTLVDLTQFAALEILFSDNKFSSTLDDLPQTTTSRYSADDFNRSARAPPIDPPPIIIANVPFVHWVTVCAPSLTRTLTASFS